MNVKIHFLHSLLLFLLLALASSALVLGNPAGPTILRTIPVGAGPRQAAITPDGTRVYVSNYDSNSVSVIDTTTNNVTTEISVGKKPNGIAVTPAGLKVYVANQYGSSVSVIDVGTNTLVKTIKVGRQPKFISITPDGKKAYVSCVYSGLYVIDTATNTISKVIEGGRMYKKIGCPEGSAVTPDGKRLYLATQCAPPPGRWDHDPVYVIDTTTDSVVDAMVGPQIVCEGVAITPDGSQVWIRSLGRCTLAIIDTSSNKFVETLFLGDRVPGGAVWPISITPDGKFAYGGFKVGSDQKLWVIDTTTLRTTKTLDIAATGSVAFTPDGKRGYAPVPTQDLVAVIGVRERDTQGSE